MNTSTGYELFKACNHTELLQLCLRQGIRVSPATPREDLIAYLLGDREIPPNNQNNIDTWRHGLMGFLLDHWGVMRSQLDCPAKSGSPDACFNCIDAQVVSCVAGNPANEQRINFRRKQT